MNEKQQIQMVYSDVLSKINDGTYKNDEKSNYFYEQASHFSKINGNKELSEKILLEIITRHFHSRKFVNTYSKNYEALTIHSAKNREFDHVYILWQNELCEKFSDEQKRRLLYNAITRAKMGCKLIVIGSQNSLARMPVVSLLVK